ncbi:exodeoxyribonuclease VII large subunit [Acidicapsa ligni]|uniref:exodeoxyribonuclease VII large subunit n=1 Tax=Acidicapsa ligni TaxID=542300 RepID=UPI0021E07D7C|nr:exodeoxyribonuclease VII large subunit [Acidicapsa ligni]
MSPKRTAKPQLDLLFGAREEASPTSETKPEPTSRSRDRARRTWLVHQLVSEAREVVEQEFGDVWVEGEISNYRPASSGHLYFTLKDAEAQLPVVLFRRQAQLLRFRPEDGLHVRVRGKVTIYEQRGQIQLVAETMEPVGAGSLQLAFEQLRDQLKAEGLFEQDRKQPLPAFPRSVAVITSPTGAVIRDFLNIVGRRHSGLDVVVVPVSVQGDAAAAEIEAALVQMNALRIADVIVIARGGGSLEDMAAFNSERVARAIAASELPVVSAVGHETDFTIADFVADLRAPTPSAAAELITEAQHKIADYIEALEQRIDRGIRFQLLQARQHFARLPASRTEQRMMTTLHRLEQRLDELAFRMENAMVARFREDRLAVTELRAAVLRHDPRQQLGAAREALSAWQSRLHHALDRSLTSKQHRTHAGEDRLYRAAQVHVANRRAALGTLRGQLQSLSPLAVLQRGYALVQDENGVIVRSIERLTTNQQVATQLGDGTFISRVETTSRSIKKDRKTST